MTAAPRPCALRTASCLSSFQTVSGYRRFIRRTGQTIRCSRDRRGRISEIKGGGYDGIAVRIFQWNDDGSSVCEIEIWKPGNFINAVNKGEFCVEFITRRNEYAALAFECWLVFDAPPYHLDCEITMNCEAETYLWNELRYDRPW